MTSHVPRQFRLTEGVDAYNPDVIEKDLVFAYLNNVDPRLGRLWASKGYASFQNLALSGSDRIISFGSYQLASRQYNDLYAFSRTKVFWFNFSTGLFDTTPIYTSFYSSDDPYVLIPWYGALYVTKPLSPYVRLQHKTATVISNALSARYGLLANSHAYFASVNDGVTNHLGRIRWSDLDDPESIEFDAQSSEADFFDLEPDSRQITGVSYQRGTPLVYAENNIWGGTPIGFPGGFRHDPLFPGIGNIFHNAVIRNKEVDFFIAQDNIYALNGLQLEPIGDAIYDRFINSVKISSDTSVRGYIDSRKDQVFWVYTKTDDSLWSIVYNYKEKKWSERDPQSLTAWWDSPRVAMRGYDAIDDIATLIDNVATMIDDPAGGYPVVLPQLGGTSLSPAIVVKANDANLRAVGTAFSHLIETFDFYFDTIGEVSEITKALIEYTGAGTPNLTVSIGTRDNQSAAIVWSATKAVDTSKGSLAFFIRSIGVGKYIRFRFAWGNTDANRITDLRLLSLVKVEEEDVTVEK